MTLFDSRTSALGNARARWDAPNLASISHSKDGSPVSSGRTPSNSTDATSLRQALQLATRDVHERLHDHAGLASVQNRTITRANYVRLLARLYGFYAPFETAARLRPLRSGWLEADLAALGIGPELLDGIPLCGGYPLLVSTEDRLGALYVVEGSALGGVGLARHLDGLLGAGVLDGRRFFSGRCSETGPAWRAYLLKLSSVSPAPQAQAKVISAAVETFALFERWIDGWNDNDD